MKLIAGWLCLVLAAAAGVTPASAQKFANFNDTAVSNNCNFSAIDLLPANILLRRGEAKVLTTSVHSLLANRFDRYVPENGFTVKPGWACNFQECISSRVTLMCFSVDGSQRVWHTFNRTLTGRRHR